MPEEKKRILVVEDEPEILEILRLRLESERFEVLAAPDGIEGLRLAFEAGPDLLILDLLLPGIKGPEICRRVKSGERTKEIPVIILSASDGDGEKAGADAYVAKPYDWKELRGKIRELTG